MSLMFNWLKRTTRARLRRVRPAFDALESRWTPATLIAPDLLSQSDTGVSAFDNLTRDNQPLFAGTTTSPAGTILQLYVDNLAQASYTIPKSGGTVFNIKPTSTLADGSHTVRFFDGRSQTFSASLAIVIDTSAPSMPTTPDLEAASDSGSSSTDNITRVKTPNFTIQGEAGARLTLHVGAMQTSVVATGSPQSVNIDATSLLVNGVASVDVWTQAQDPAGNLSPASAILPVVIDTTAPAAATLALDPAGDSGISTTDGVTNATTLRFTGAGEPGATATLCVDGVAAGTATVDQSGQFQFVVGPLAEGAHAIVVKQTDAAGNSGPASNSVAVRVDLTSPTITDLALVHSALSPNGDGIFDGGHGSFKLSEPANVTLALVDATGTTLSFTSLGNLPAGPQSFDLNVAGLTEGSYLARLDAIDIADSPATPAATPFTIKLTPPAVSKPDLSGAHANDAGGGNRITNQTTQTVTGTADPGATIVLCDGTTPVGTATAGTNGVWSITTTLAEGDHPLTAKATDSAGNTATSGSVVIIVDTTPPRIDVGAAASSPEGSSFSRTAQIVELHPGSEAWSMVSSTTGQQIPPSTGPTLTFTPVRAGVYVFRHTATDLAGNTATADLAFTAADVPATLSVIGPTSGNAGDPYTVNLASTDPGGDPVDGWHLAWGDGASTDLPGAATQAIHVYASTGAFAITASATQHGLAISGNGPNVQVAGNAAPILNSLALALPAIDEDPVGQFGFFVTDVVDALGITDDPGSAVGIAITALDNSHGRWQFTLDAGATWTPIATPSAGSAWVFAADANTGLRFAPAPNFNGSSTFSARAWDQSDHSANGSLVKVASVGGLSAFSSQVAVVTQPITPVNDPPTLKMTTAAKIYRNQSLAFGTTIASISVADIDSPELRVTIAADHGTLKLGSSVGLKSVVGNGTGNLILIGAPDILNARLASLIYAAPTGYVGAVAVSTTVNDEGTDATPHEAAATLALSIVNRPPVAIGPLTYVAYLNTPLTIAAPGIRSAFSDPDGDPLTVSLVAPPSVGTLAIRADGSFTYTPPRNYVGTVSFSVQVSDGVDSSTVLPIVIQVKNPFALRR